jgi:hypothetical protein
LADSGIRISTILPNWAIIAGMNDDVRDPIQQVRGDPQNPTRQIISVPSRKAFFAEIVGRLRSDLPPELQSFHHRGDFNLMKVWFDHYRVHYEVVIDQQIDKIEIGLHFEDGPASSLAFLALLDKRILEIKDVLGPNVELERWTQSWARIYELRPLEAITEAETSACAERLVSLIGYLQPIVEASGIRLDRPGV